jgi:hypothetical protein
MTNLFFELPIPATLDAIVTRNRERCEIGLATEAEIEALHGDIDAPASREKDLLTDYRFIAFRIQQCRTTRLVLLGEAMRQAVILCTSEVQVLSRNGSCVRTRNSIYRLAGQGEGEPPVAHLLHFCATLHEWGLGPILGVLEVW